MSSAYQREQRRLEGGGNEDEHTQPPTYRSGDQQLRYEEDIYLPPDGVDGELNHGEVGLMDDGREGERENFHRGTLDFGEEDIERVGESYLDGEMEGEHNGEEEDDLLGEYEGEYEYEFEERAMSEAVTDLMIDTKRRIRVNRKQLQKNRMAKVPPLPPPPPSLEMFEQVRAFYPSVYIFITLSLSLSLSFRQLISYIQELEQPQHQHSLPPPPPSDDGERTNHNGSMETSQILYNPPSEAVLNGIYDSIHTLRDYVTGLEKSIQDKDIELELIRRKDEYNSFWKMKKFIEKVPSHSSVVQVSPSLSLSSIDSHTVCLSVCLSRNRITSVLSTTN